MRALLLIVIGGGLLWLLIQGFGPSLAKDSEQDGTSGTMLHEDPASGSPGGKQDATPQTAPPAAAPSEPAPTIAEKPQEKAPEPPPEPKVQAPAQPVASEPAPAAASGPE